jgi:hypothetical protein
MDWSDRISAWVDDVCETLSPEQTQAGRLLLLIEEFLTNIRPAIESERETPGKAA